MNVVWRLVLLACFCALPAASQGRQDQRPPNFIIVYADDLGYADIGPFSTRTGAARPQTPNLDRMSAEGIRLTSFYVAQAVCSASRAALLTGAYPNRVGIQGALNHTAQYGINPSEMTIAEVLKQRGYATAIYGKWHLGSEKPFLPLQHGFDEYLGLPYSNDMWPRHPTQKDFYPDLPFIEGNKVTRLDPDQSQLTTWYTERAVSFIERNRDEAVLSLRAAQHAARAAVRVGQVQGQDERRAVWRRHRRARLVGGPDSRRREARRARQRHDGHLHVRQRTVAVVRQPRRFVRTISRGQGNDFRGRRARAVRGPLAGAHSRRSRRRLCRR